MSKVKMTFVFIGLLFAGSIQAKNYMTFMGGGGEPKGDRTIFDNSIMSFHNFAADNDWETQVTFNGGHRKTEEILSQVFKTKSQSTKTPINTPFTEESFNKTIENYIAQINSGKISKGEQILLLASSHGSKKDEDEKSHSISVTSDPSKGTSSVSMDKLQNLISLTESKGIKLAIVDFSCYSGHSMSLNSPNTCIISATGPNHYGYLNNKAFANTFITRMRKGRSLESVFLEARETSSDSAFPMISTPVGLELNEIIYSPLSPFLYVHTDKRSPLEDYLKGRKDSGDVCELVENYNSITQLINTYNNGMFNYFKESVDEYYELLSKYKKELDDPLMRQLPDEKFCDDQNVKCITYTVDEVLSMEIRYLREFYTSTLETASGENAERLKRNLERLDKVEVKQKELTRRYPDMAKRSNLLKGNRNLINHSHYMTESISNNARVLYKIMYSQKSAQDKRHNPCKDFIL